VDSATLNGKDFTDLMNQLIEANGFRDPTQGVPMPVVFREDGALQVTKGKRSENFPHNTPPPYDLSVLFVPLGPQGAQPSYRTMPPMQNPMLSKAAMPQYSTMPPMLPPTATQPPMTSSSLGVPQQGDGNVVAVVEIDKIADLPAPRSGGPGEVVLHLRDETGKEIASAGPFKARAQGNLRVVECPGAKLIAKCTMEQLAKGYLGVVATASYKDMSGMMSSLTGGSLEKIGQTEIFKVSWAPVPLKYYEFFTAGRKVGGIGMAHRFARESDIRSMVGTGAESALPPPPGTGAVPFNGPTRAFAPDSLEAKAELAALALEGQNRAFAQRIKQADQNSRDDPRFVTMNDNGYREWKDLDSLFITLGPNYVAQSNEIGPNICRVYEDDTSVWQELMQKEGVTALHPVSDQQKSEANFDKVTKMRLVKTMYPGDPDKIQATLRPLMCRDRDDIKRDEMKLLNNPEGTPQAAYSVKVIVKRALNLRTKEGFMLGRADPKVVVEIPGKPQSKWETPPAPDGYHPEWNKTGEIKGWQQGDSLKFTVVEKDWIGFGSHLGEQELKTHEFYPEPFRSQIPLFRAGQKGNQISSGAKQAQLLVEVRVVGPLGGSKDWPPSTRTYAPLQNLNIADQETQRLANWDPAQCAKLSFADVSPNYQINEDIWGALADTKATNSALMPRPPNWKPNRIKDQCAFA
jgi:hypothetical protein